MATIVTQEMTSAWNGARLRRLKQQSQGLLEQVAQMPGVHGACLCDNRGAILGMLLVATGSRRLFERIGLALTQCLAALGGQTAVKSLEVRLERKLVVARDLGHALLVLVCETEVNVSVLRMALDVATNAFETDAELQRGLAQAEPSRSVTLSPEHLDAPAQSLLQKAGLKAS